MDHLKRCKTSNLLDDVLQWFSNLTLPFWLFHLISNKSRGARPSVTTLPNEAMSLKGKQLGTPSCVPADSF